MGFGLRNRHTSCALELIRGHDGIGRGLGQPHRSQAGVSQPKTPFLSSVTVLADAKQTTKFGGFHQAKQSLHRVYMDTDNPYTLCTQTLDNPYIGCTRTLTILTQGVHEHLKTVLQEKRIWEFFRIIMFLNY